MQYSSLKIFVKSFSIVTLCASTLSQAETKRLILLGPTGVGKTTLINAIYNTAIDTTEFDNYRYITQTNRGQSNAIPPRKAQLVQNFSNHVTETLYAEDIAREKQRTQLDADTRDIVGYRFQPNISGWNIDDDLEIIDVPGFNDTEGEHITRKVTESISQYLNEHPNSLHAIGIVFNETETRNTAQYSQIFAQLERLFATSDLSEQVVTFINFSQFDYDINPSIRTLAESYLGAMTTEQYYPINLSYLANANRDKHTLPARRLSTLQDDFKSTQESLRKLLLDISQIDKTIQTEDYKKLIAASNQSAELILEYTDNYLQLQQYIAEQIKVESEFEKKRADLKFILQHLIKEEYYKDEKNGKYVKKVFIDEENKERSIQIANEMQNLERQYNDLGHKIIRFGRKSLDLIAVVRITLLSTCINNSHAKKMLQNPAEYQALVQRSLLELHPELEYNVKRKQEIIAQIKKILA